MKPLCTTLCLALAALCLTSVPPARAQSGRLLRTFNVKAGRLLLDPARPRLYATLPQDNGIAVIDTNTNTVLTTFFIGSNPVDMAISPDGTRLYVANNGSTAAGIGVVDLTNLTTLASLPVPSHPSGVAAGLGNRLYVLTGASNNGIVQLDAATGTVQGTFGGSIYGGYVRLSPDRATLFYGNSGLSPSSLRSFDVSTATPGTATTAGSTGSDGQGLTISHNGQFFIYPNGSSQGNYSTYLIPTNNLSSVLGTFATGAYPGVGTFSADDRLLYQVQNNGGSNGQSAFEVFDTRTFTQVDRFVDPNLNSTAGRGANVTDIAVTAPHGYLYVAQMGSTDATFLVAGNLEMLSTQRAAFFDGSASLPQGFYYLKFADGVPFGYYNFNNSPYLYHIDLGFEYPTDAADGNGGIYLYDFKSSTFWYTSSSLFPYLYDFKLNTFLYYYADPTNPDRYNTNGVRYFFNFATGRVITK